MHVALLRKAELDGTHLALISEDVTSKNTQH